MNLSTLHPGKVSSTISNEVRNPVARISLAFLLCFFFSVYSYGSDRIKQQFNEDLLTPVALFGSMADDEILDEIEAVQQRLDQLTNDGRVSSSLAIAISSALAIVIYTTISGVEEVSFAGVEGYGSCILELDYSLVDFSYVYVWKAAIPYLLKRGLFYGLVFGGGLGAANAIPIELPPLQASELIKPGLLAAVSAQIMALLSWTVIGIFSETFDVREATQVANSLSMAFNIYRLFSYIQQMRYDRQHEILSLEYQMERAREILAVRKTAAGAP